MAVSNISTIKSNQRKKKMLSRVVTEGGRGMVLADKKGFTKISIDNNKGFAYTIIRIIKHFSVFVRAALRRRSIFLNFCT